MSSKFKKQAAGVYKVPPVCISKAAELNVRPPPGLTLVAIVSGDGVGILGPWSVNASIKLRRNSLSDEWQSNVVPASSGAWYQVQAQPQAGVGPIQFHLAFFRLQDVTSAYWSGDVDLGLLTPGVYFERRIVEWATTTGSGRADARVWIS
jgi:hypothetical protein